MSSALLKMSHKPAISVARDARVMAAIHLMFEMRVGACLVLEGERPAGIFTERDLMVKVIFKKLDPETTPVSAVMTSPVVPIDAGASVADALRLMVTRNFRHLPIVDKNAKVLGMLSMRQLMREQIDRLEQQVGALENYIGAEGVAGG
jgi:CBS domain-containing protein